jgi:hypothetical protein
MKLRVRVSVRLRIRTTVGDWIFFIWKPPKRFLRCKSRWLQKLLEYTSVLKDFTA